MAGKLTSKSSTSSKWSSSSTSSRSSSYLEENRKSSPSRLLLLKSELDNNCFVSFPLLSPVQQHHPEYRGTSNMMTGKVSHVRFSTWWLIWHTKVVFLFQQRLVLAALSGKPVKLKNLRAVEDDSGLKGVSTTELILEITAFSAANFSYI